MSPRPDPKTLAEFHRLQQAARDNPDDDSAADAVNAFAEKHGLGDQGFALDDDDK